MENEEDRKKLESFEFRIKIGCIIATALADIGYWTSSLPESEKFNKAVLIFLIAVLIGVFRKKIARFALAERWRRWRDRNS